MNGLSGAQRWVSLLETWIQPLPLKKKKKKKSNSFIAARSVICSSTSCEMPGRYRGRKTPA